MISTLFHPYFKNKIKLFVLPELKCALIHFAGYHTLKIKTTFLLFKKKAKRREETAARSSSDCYSYSLAVR